MRERIEGHKARIREARPDEPAIDLLFRVEERGGVSEGTLTIVVGGASVERAASSSSCADVVAALSMMAAIAIGEEARPSPTDGANEPSAPVAKAPRAVPPKRTLAPAAPRRRERVVASVGSGFEINGNRGSVLLATGFAQLAFPLAPFEPAIRVGVARSTSERVSSPNGVIAIRWSEVTFAGCADVVREGAVRVGPCLNVELGRLETTVLAPLPSRRFSYLWLTTGASARIAWRILPPLSFEAMIGARAPLIRSELFFEPFMDATAYRAPPIVPFAAVGFIARLP